MRALGFRMPRIVGAFLLMLLAAIVGSAQERPSTPPRESGERDAADALEKSLRNYRIRLAQDGFLSGRIHVVDPQTGTAAPLTDLTLSFVQNGKEVARSQPDQEGVFEVRGLKPGVYSLVGAGPGGYIAYGLQALPPVGVPEPKVEARTVSGPGVVPVRPAFFQEVVERLQIDSLAVPPRDYATVARLMRSYIPATILSAQPGGELPKLAQPAERREQDQESPDPNADDPVSTVLQRHSVQIRSDGSLVGRTRRIHPETGKPTRLRRLNVFLVRDNAIVAQAPVTETGTFTFRSVAPGLYSFVAAGLEGFAAFSVQAVAADRKTGFVPQTLIVPVALEDQSLLPLDGTLVPPEDVSYVSGRLSDVSGEQVASINSDPMAPGSGSKTDVTTGHGSGSGSFGNSTTTGLNSPVTGAGGGGGGYPGGGGGGGGRGVGTTRDEVPEIDPQSAAAAIALILGTLLLLLDRRCRTT